ncbi:MAG: hypothetical protein AB4080_00360 [Trichodesmium sp.]
MSKLRWLILSSSASGFGLCSILFALFILLNELTIFNFFIFILVIGFFLGNLVFTAHYFSLISRELYIRNKMQSQMKMRAKPTRYRY